MLGNPTTIALTATATDQVRRDIVEHLALDEPEIFITGFARENLFYEVLCPRSDREKADMLVEFLPKIRERAYLRLHAETNRRSRRDHRPGYKATCGRLSCRPAARRTPRHARGLHERAI